MIIEKTIFFILKKYFQSKNTEIYNKYKNYQEFNNIVCINLYNKLNNIKKADNTLSLVKKIK